MRIKKEKINKNKMKKLLFIMFMLVQYLNAQPFSMYSGIELKNAGKKFFIVRSNSISLVINDKIEINRDTFINDTCKCPILFIVTIDKIDIIDSCKRIKYKHIKCNIKNCKVIHLDSISRY